MTESISVGWDPQAVLDDASAVGALRCLGQGIRAHGFLNVNATVEGPVGLTDLATGKPVEGDVAAQWLGGPDAVDALVATGGAERTHEGMVTLLFEVLSGAGGVAVLPRPGLLADEVYSSSDSWVLLEMAWRFGLGGDRAVDLGTGTGLVANFLTSRYQRVQGTDILPVAVDTAAMSRELLDEDRRGRLAVSVNDVAAGLTMGTFDLVVANTPWVPSPIAGRQTYADGGPTGFELPLRFLVEGAKLLSERGRLVLLCADLRYADGRTPLWEALDRLARHGFTYEVETTPRTKTMSFEAQDAPNYMDDLEAAAHVAVMVYRP